MNDKFYALPQEKQDRILNAGFRVFSRNSYKKSPMMEIANEYKEGLDLKLMYQDMYLASEGYIYQMQNLGDVDVDKMVSDYRRIIDFWKQLYKR